MSLGKRLFIGGAAAECTTDTADIFGDSSGIALYSLDYDGSDASGNYDGTPSNVTFGDIGHINYAASFNGTSSKIDIPAMTAANIKTVSFWINSTDSGANKQIFSMGKSGSYNWLNIRLNAGKIEAGYGSDNGGYMTGSAITTNSTYNDGNWHHVVCTFTGTYGTNQTPNIYVDDTDVATTALSGSGSAHTVTGDGAIGYYNAQSILYIDALIDQFRVLNKVVSSSEVSTLYAEERCVYDSTTDNNALGGTNVAYYKFDGDYTDEKGSYDGTVYNVAGFKFGRFGTAADFNGTESRMNTGYTRSGSAFAWSFWIYATDTGLRQVIFADSNAQGQDASSSFSIQISAADNFGVYLIGSGGSHLSVSTSYSNYFNKWTHVVVSVSGSRTATVWLDNNKTVGSTATSDWRDGVNPIAIGHWWSGATSPSADVKEFEGLMDQVRLFNSSLDQDDVDALYAEKQEHITLNSTDPFGDGDCELYYKFDNNANDSSGNSYTTVASNISYSSSDKLFGTHSADFATASSKFEQDTITLSAITVSFWVKIPDVDAQYNLVNMYEGEDRIFNIYTYSGTFYALNYWNGNHNNPISFDPDTYMTDNKWHHIAYSINETEQPQFYLDGVLLKTASGSLGYYGDTETPDLEIGYSTSSYDFRGKMDQFRIFERKLTGQEIFQLYAEGVLNE